MKNFIESIKGARKIFVFVLTLFTLAVLVGFDKVTGTEMVGALQVMFGFFIGGNAAEHYVKTPGDAE